MPLRSDFSIDAETPEEPRGGAHVARVLTDQVNLDLDTGVQTQAFIRRQAKRDRTGDIELESLDSSELGPQRRRVAFLVTHGMGQQVPFETLSMLGQALITQHGEHSKGTEAPAKLRPKLRRVRLTNDADAPELSRVEVTLPGNASEAVDVHIYESYWAPFTEGQISFTATCGFLYLAAWNGIKTAVTARWRAMKDLTGEMTPQQKEILDQNKHDRDDMHFDRWMFGQFRDMPIKRWTFYSLVALVVVMTLLLLPALMLFTPWGITAIKALWGHINPAQQHWSVGFELIVIGAGVIVVTLAAVVRYLVVEFVGDVAIYVSSYKVSRYDEIRTKILTEVFGVARQIYSAGISDQRQLVPYDDVIIVGHSLGSVISYDLLNRSINWDQVENQFKYKVVGRTKRLITFGSPLDKTAFLFRTQVSSARNLREALAARQQPLILDYKKFRPLGTFKWVNIYSRRDIISGSLEYYDVKTLKHCNAVENIPDPEATRPLLAHVQYWENSLLHEKLYEAAWAGARAAAKQATSPA